jgi:hypothetical protein
VYQEIYASQLGTGIALESAAPGEQVSP